ncbi:MAG: orotidine-5'-phosphate decarboxylase [Bacteroidia bacterium]|nr:orotidine-5'-phosphate decarboxylase [Bacteroidia bacterium]MDW8089215.1 orotidine-5'-phosphate decarboxylase [Bacteroidia bacterium]
MTERQLYEAARRKASLLCVGLDPSEAVLPAWVWAGGLAAIEAYLRWVVAETAPYAIAYKLNVAFYERWGADGWHLLARVRQALPSEVLVIADAKRADITHTNHAYAQAFWETLAFEALTLSPYFGWEALRPFWTRKDKWVFVLLRTTEAPSWQASIWEAIVKEKPTAHEAVIGWVWGLSYGSELPRLRRLRPTDWLLVPGAGAQSAALDPNLPLFPALVVVARAILQNPQTAAFWASQTAGYIPPNLP